MASGKSFVRQKSRRRAGTTNGHLMSCWKLVVVISDMVDRQEGVVHDSLQFHWLLLQSLILLRFMVYILVYSERETVPILARKEKSNYRYRIAA